MLYGVVDLGANTIRLSVYRREGDRIQLLFSRKITAGLAGYVEPGPSGQGELSPQGIEAACRALRELVETASLLPLDSLDIFATASLRQVSNRDRAVEAIQASCGKKVEVLSGEEEARLSFLGAVGDRQGERGFLVDLGGGSTELVAFDRGRIVEACSLSMGCLSLFRRHVSFLFPTLEEREALVEEVGRQLEVWGPFPWERPAVFAVGGTARAACRLAGRFFARGEDPGELTGTQLDTLLARLAGMDREMLGLVLKTAPDRVHTLVPGMLALREILRRLGGEKFRVSPWGVREGYVKEKVLGKEDGLVWNIRQ